MSAISKIAWTERTWNPVIGCSKVSEGCRNCYAIRMAHRLGANPQTPQYKGLTQVKGGKPEWTNKVYCLEDRLLDPLSWKKPRMIFVNSMSDLFHEDVPDEFIDKVFAVMALCPQHFFQVLTKRPKRMADYLNGVSLVGGTKGRTYRWDCKADKYRTGDLNESIALEFPLQNVWIGTSIEDQETADERIPHLLQCPAVVRFLSCEPLLGAVYLTRIHDDEIGATWDVLEMGISQVIVGGESGPGARPMNPDWARSLRDQCASAGVPFFFKHWGEWVDEFHPKVNLEKHKVNSDFVEPCGENYDYKGIYMFRVGKKAAGRLLDGRTWDEYPKDLVND